MGRDREEIKSQILSKSHTLFLENVPIGWSCSVLDFINRLLEPEQTLRLGSRNIQEIMQHEWFRDFDWQLLKQGGYRNTFNIDFQKDNFKEAERNREADS